MCAFPELQSSNFSWVEAWESESYFYIFSRSVESVKLNLKACEGRLFQVGFWESAFSEENLQNTSLYDFSEIPTTLSIRNLVKDIF